MAKTVGELLVQLEVEGIEGVKALKSSLRGLSNASNASDKQLEQLAKGVKKFGGEGKRSREVIAGQVDALKKLRTQANLGGEAFESLTKDVINYERKLAAADLQIDKTTAKFKTFAQVANQIPARRPDAFAGQIGKLNKDLGDLSVTSDKYLNLLRQIQERSQAFSRAQARQAVIGRAQTAATGVIDPRVGQIVVNRELPNTTAALSLRISELKENLQNLDFTSNEYRDTQREVLAIEKQLTDIGKQRVEAIKGVTAQQRRAEQLAERSRGRKQRLIAGQTATNAEFNAALGAHMAAPAMPVQRLSDLYQSIGQISAAAMARDVEMMGNSYRKVAADINMAARAGNGNISSLQNQRASFVRLRNVLDPLSKDFREVTREIEKLDTRLRKLDRKPRMGGAQIAQGAGAIASAGIFGGVEGLIGSAAGFALGGPLGAVVGGGIGAQANQIRKQLGALAEYTTQLNLSKQTLALAANGQEEYNKLLAISREISNDYALGLKETIGGFAQIAVAARANNLSLEETETIYRGLVSSGVAFGKSQEDINAIVRATVQVLSKGKLSAEELSGQLGERMPGAVAKFAEATGRTLPELAAALKAGEVSIDDFVDFSKKQLFDYDKVAKLIGDSPEKAGARLKLALDEAVENYGGFFQRAGAGFQDLFKKIIDFVNDNKTAIRNMVIDFIIQAEKIKEVFAGLGRDIVNTLAPPLKFVVDMFGRGVDAIHGAVMRERDLMAGGFNAEQALNRAESAAQNVTPNLSVGGFEIPNTQRLHPSFTGNVQEAYRVEQQSALIAGRKLREEAGGSVDFDAMREELEKIFDFEVFKYGEFKSGQGSGDLTTPPGGAGGAGMKDITKELADAKIARINLDKDAIIGVREQIELEADLSRKAAQQLPTQKQRVELAEINKRETEQLAALEERIKESGKAMAEKLIERMNASQSLNRNLQDSLAKRKLELGLITQEEFNQLEIARERQRLEALRDPDKGGITDSQIEEQMDMFKKVLNQTPIDKFIKSAKDSLNDLHTVAVNISQGIGNAVGNAMTSGIMGLIEGTKTAKEVFADFLKSVGRILAQEGAKMIATYIAIGVAKIFAGLGSATAGGGSSVETITSKYGSFGAEGAAKAAGSLPPLPKANGGPVEAGRPYMVGERGPEMFIPGSNGGIMRNEDMRRMMGRSPAGAGVHQMNFTFETTNIGGTEFVSREQLEQAMVVTRRQATNDGAKRGMSMTLDKMQNSPRTRSRVGIS